MIKAGLSRLAAAMAVGVLLAGCSLMRPSPDVDAATKAVYKQVRLGDPALQSTLVPELRNADTSGELARIRTLLPPGEPKSVKAVGWTRTVTTGAPESALVRHLYDYGDRRVLAETRIQRSAVGGLWQVSDFHVRVATRAELAGNAFTLAGRSLAQYAFLAATVMSPLLMIAALVVVIRRRNLKWKWLWCVLAFFGLFSFGMNWSDGQVGAQWLTLQLIGAGISSDGTGFTPWFLKFTVPLGALLILTGVWAKPRKPKLEETPS